MARHGEDFETLLTEAEVADRVAALAARLAPMIDDEAVVVCLLLGGLWFAADLTRALARLGRMVSFDALWLSSYGDARRSGGHCEVLAPFQRSLAGRDVVIADDVLDSGRSMGEAARLAREAGARRVITTVFARKPWPDPRPVDADLVGWEAPARFLVGYGMDAAGLLRGLPHVAAAADNG